MNMAANRHKNIRAALCYDIKSTKLSRQHNNANVMTIGSRLTKKNVALRCVNMFIKTNFEGGRHLLRIKKYNNESKLNKYTSNSYQNFFDNDLSISDPDLYNSIKLELQRQQEHIELIASENIVSKAVLDAQGSVMTNKYAEGYPSKRYYGGCEFVDKAEDLALERVKKLI